MVSYDVCSLFTNVPLHETIDIAEEIIFENKNRNLNIFSCMLHHKLILLLTKKCLTKLMVFPWAHPLKQALANLFILWVIMKNND